MTSVPPEFVNVDMRELKAAPVERARIDGISVSALVRGAVAARLGLGSVSALAIPNALQKKEEGTVRLSVRL